MHFRILGPLEALEEGRVVSLGGSKQRALLALLLLHANETLSADRLIDELWGERPPATAAKTLQVHVSRLRKTLAGADGNGLAGLVVTRGHGYELELDPDHLDAHRFERLVLEGRRELAAGRGARAASALEHALSLWRGPALADLAYEPFAQPEIARLADLRVNAEELWIDAQLELGRHEAILGRIEALIDEHPYRERLRAQLMVALYRSDRQADALQAYQDARRALVQELGLEPGERLRELERAVLAQDPVLAAPAPQALELPAELDVDTLLAGRGAELDWLRAHWRSVADGAGRLVLLAGGPGLGRTRLAAELAGEVHGDGAPVVYGAAADAPAAIQRASEAVKVGQRSALLVLDDVDGVAGELRAALGELAGGLAALPVLVVAIAEDARLASEVGAEAHLTLAPLDAGGVAAIAHVYAGARQDVSVPVAQLAELSGGVPARVHQVAGDWARGEAERRVNGAARRAASERAGLRSAEDELASTVAQLQAVRGRVELMEGDADGVVVCPFKGLASFDVEDAEFFFGRERLVAEMIARLAGAPLMGIVGPSGSGKSSALRAGLLPALASGALPGSGDWAVALMRPGEQPLRALEQSQNGVAPGRRLVLAIDQFEELFTACRAESERTAFVDSLVTFAQEPRRRVLVLMAIRADFYGRCAGYPDLWRLLGANQVPVGPMDHHELRRAIELPARRAGLRVEAGLVDELVADVAGEPGALPLLSTALLELWKHRDGRHLRMSEYRRTGGVRGAVARLAESTYERLDGGEREVARRILLRLAGEGEGDAIVRRRVAPAELGTDRDERVAGVLSALAADRLVTVGDDEVEVAHEALLREWPRLRGWLNEDAEGRRLHGRLRGAARDWDAGGRDPGELYRGARLASVLDWAAAHEADLNEVERAFLGASRTASERSQRRLRAVLAGVAALLVLAVIGGVVALEQRRNAREEALAADAQRLGARALVEDDLERSLLLARQGVALDDTVQTRGNLLAALLESPAALGVLRGDGDPMNTVALSPDGRTVAAGSTAGEVFLFDARTRRRVASAEPVRNAGWEGILDLAFSPDGSRLAVAHGGAEGSGVAVLDVRSRRVVTRATLPPNRSVSGLAYSAGGRALETTVFSYEGTPALYTRFDARTGHRLLGPVRINRGGRAPMMATSDGRRLVTAGQRRTTVRDAASLRVLRSFPVGTGSDSPDATIPYALSGDDRTVAIGGADGSVRLLDLRTGELSKASGRHGAPVNSAQFTPDGRTLVTTGDDGDVILWDVQQAVARETLSGHSGAAYSPVVTPDGRVLYTASQDGTVFIWDLLGSGRLARPFRTATGNVDRAYLALSSDGRLLAMGQADGAMSITDAQTLAPPERFPVAPDGQVLGNFLPDSHTMAVGGPAGFLALVDADRGKALRRLRGHRGQVWTPSISADGRLLATGSDDKTVRFWSLPDGRARGAPLRFRADVNDVQLSPDGRWLAVGLFDLNLQKGKLEIWDTRSRRRVTSLSDEDSGSSARFSPDGRLLAVGSLRGTARVWSTESWKPVTRVFAGHAGWISNSSFSGDRRTLATGSEDGTVRLWDIESEQAIGGPLRGIPKLPAEPYFTADGSRLIANYDSGLAYLWDIRTESLVRHACAVAGRSLTRDEWDEFLPGRDYDPAC
jgi:WD40 repeat protein/DNA-binding SARP family transcriptional activator